MPRGRTKIDFTDFWNAYGRKFDRTAALRAWGRLTDLDRRAALRGIPSYRDECQRQGIAMMYPHGYLTHRRWEDEREEPSVTCRNLPSPTATKKEQSGVSGFKFQVSRNDVGSQPKTCNLKPETSASATDTLSDMDTW